MLGRVAERIPDLFRIVLLVKSAYRAGNYTLTAGNARGGSERKLESGSDMRIEAAVIRTYDSDTLHILAGTYATAAENTLLIVANEKCRALIVSRLGILALKMLLIVYTVVAAELLKLTILTADAGEAFSLMSGKNKLEVCLSVFLNFGSVCEYLHAIVCGGYACCHETARTLYFYKAKTAGAYLVDALEIAERGDINICGAGGVENG